MPVEFKLPELGENVEKGDVVRVLVAPGDIVKVDQSVVELETDKATIEVPTSIAGKVSEVRVKPGDKVKVGQVVLVLDAAAAADAPKTAPKPNGAAAPEKPAAPAAEAKKEQASRKADAGTAPEEASKPDAAAAKAPAKTADVVDFSSARPSAPAREAALSRPDAPARTEAAAAVPAAPSVRRYARELGVEIGDVSGTGPGGRIGQDDVKEHVKGLLNGGGAGHRVADGPLPDFTKWGAVDVKPMSNIRRKTAEHLSAAWQAPHVTQHDKADVTALEAFRHEYGPRVEKTGGKLTVTAILIKIVAAGIARFPQFASSVDMAHDAIVYKKYTHIGVAVDTPNGLLVPVIRDADQKTITQIADELGALSQKARDKKLTLEEMSGGVMSITNLGGIGGTSFTPIVNRPEVAILGVSRTQTDPVWVSPSTSSGAGASLGTSSAGQFQPRLMLPLSLSYDHRVIDGADAARFLRFVCDALEQPLSMLL